MKPYQSCEIIRNITVKRGAPQLTVRTIFKVKLKVITQTKVASLILVLAFIEFPSVLY